jgi:hypothetical protein
MTSKRLFFVLSSSLVLLVGLSIAGVIFGNLFLERETRKIIDLKIESLALDEQQRSLIQAKKDIDKYAELEQISRSVVPQEKDQARTVREIIKLAEESGVPIANISFPASNLGQGAAKKPASTQPSSDSESTKSPAAPTTQATQVKPVEGIPGVYQLEITVQSASSSPVPYENMLAFLSRLEQNRRTAHITNLSVTPSSANRNRVVFNLVVNAYIKP